VEFLVNFATNLYKEHSQLPKGTLILSKLQRTQFTASSSLATGEKVESSHVGPAFISYIAMVINGKGKVH
jgi:hypothetical protein